MKVLLSVLLCLGLGAGCSSSASTKVDAASVMTKAKAGVDAAPTIRVDLAISGSTLQALNGSIKRPDEFTGSLKVAGITIPVLSTGGAVYAKLPLTTKFTKVNPRTYGIPDPGVLFGATGGLSSLLTAPTDLKAGKQTRIGGDISDQITGSLPGATVAKVLPGSPATGTVNLTFGVIAKTGQLRRVEAKAGPVTYTLTLDQYGTAVTIPSP